ncbi:MAG: restriction endonuclease subunit [Flaviaesturariibacter sp.]|nr:restriction endonuclease subunit [Flaviaesturariibacter sp.]
MIDVAYPAPQFRMKREGDKQYVFDSIRKSWLLLTEEEWVRQNFVSYLIASLGYPSTLIALEKELILNGLRKRFDILVYDSSHKPWMLIECKAPHVPLNEDVLQQALRYHMTIPVPFLLLTNGNSTLGWRKEVGGLQALSELPSWPDP